MISRRVRPLGASGQQRGPLVQVEEHGHDLTHVSPIAGIVRLQEERPARRQRTADQQQEFRRDQPFVDFGRIVVRLRMIAVNLGDAGRGDVVRQQFPAAD